MPRKQRACGLVLAGIVLAGMGGLAGPAVGAVGAVEVIEPRVPFAKGELPARPGHEHRLTVKFHDHVKARVDGDGRLVSPAGVDLEPLLAAMAGSSDGPVGFAPLIDMAPADLERMLAEAAERSGRAQPDLGGMMAVMVGDAAMEAVARVLHASDLVEFVYYESLRVPLPGFFGGGFDGGPDGWPDTCIDIPPVTSDYFARQGYHGTATGIGMSEVWDTPGARGQGVRVADCEYWYDPEHEDVCNVIPEPGQTPSPWIIIEGWYEHGTAVLGEMVGGDNGYGITGLVPDAQAYFFPENTVEGGSRRVACISRAVGTMGEGDVILLEMQDWGPGGDYAPAEINPFVWQVTRVGVDRGVTVVAAAGNGSQNLDSPAYSEYRGRGDSGAIIVGAGDAFGGRSRLWYSTYGSRVNVQAWGESVFTAGYGDFIRVGGDSRQSYTRFFSGTSSASPIVASAAVSLQGIHRAATGGALAPEALRQILIDTGDLTADFDGDGVLTLFDFLAFSNEFDAGC